MKMLKCAYFKGNVNFHLPPPHFHFKNLNPKIYLKRTTRNYPNNSFFQFSFITLRTGNDISNDPPALIDRVACPIPNGTLKSVVG